ncbi:unnamed protein product [Prunus armeniaca]|uniref:Uncharacterized protein n=1 Tax=Prunus armeniaca TaxID=36596 RepID=A0A6J5WRG7_PRUAR|nr:hypothetical protein GBA52_010656 [Prunus armeniaca]CAB4302312.1 unnamed protein product [Prunus armeniaca]
MRRPAVSPVDGERQVTRRRSREPGQESSSWRRTMNNNDGIQCGHGVLTRQMAREMMTIKEKEDQAQEEEVVVVEPIKDDEHGEEIVKAVEEMEKEVVKAMEEVEKEVVKDMEEKDGVVEAVEEDVEVVKAMEEVEKEVVKDMEEKDGVVEVVKGMEDEVMEGMEKEEEEEEEENKEDNVVDLTGLEGEVEVKVEVEMKETENVSSPAPAPQAVEKNEENDLGLGLSHLGWSPWESPLEQAVWFDWDFRSGLGYRFVDPDNPSHDYDVYWDDDLWNAPFDYFPRNPKS